jgi:hypothetical protein
MRNWLIHILDHSIWITGNLTQRQIERLTQLGFDRDDWKFVKTCAYAQDKSLVAQESDFCVDSVKCYLQDEFQISVMNVEESIQHVNSI